MEKKTEQALVQSLSLFLAVAVVFSISVSTEPVQRLVSSTSSLAANAVTAVFAGVPENPYNTLALELADKEAELNARENALNHKQAVVNTTSDALLIASFAVSGVLLVLVIVNFYLDFRRRRISGEPMSYSVNLKK